MVKTPETARTADAADKDPDKHKSWFGRTMFFLANDFGLNWVVNTTASLFVTFNLSYSKPVEKWRESITQRQLRKNPGMSPAEAGKKAWHLTEVPLMMITGFAILIPMKWMENHKRQITQKLDHAWNRITGKKDEPEQAASAPDEKPRGWGEMITERLFALAFIKWVAMPLYWKTDQKYNLDGTFKDGRFNPGILHRIGKSLLEKSNGLKNALLSFSRKIDHQTVHEDWWTGMSKSQRAEAVFADQAKAVQKEALLTLVFATFMAFGGRALYKAIHSFCRSKDKQAAPPQNPAPESRQQAAQESTGLPEERPSRSRPRKRSFEEMTRRDGQEASAAL